MHIVRKRYDIVDRSSAGPLYFLPERGHVRAFQHDESDIGIPRDELARGCAKFIPHCIDIERLIPASLVTPMKEDPRELGTVVHPAYCKRNIVYPATFEVGRSKGRLACREYAGFSPPAAKGMEKWNLQEARGEDGDLDRGREFPLEHGKEAAARGYGFNTQSLKLPCAINEGMEKRRVRLPYNPGWNGTLHCQISNGEGKSLCVPDISGNPGESGVEHENPEVLTIVRETAVCDHTYACSAVKLFTSFLLRM